MSDAGKAALWVVAVVVLPVAALLSYAPQPAAAGSVLQPSHFAMAAISAVAECDDSQPEMRVSPLRLSWFRNSAPLSVGARSVRGSELAFNPIPVRHLKLPRPSSSDSPSAH